MKIAARFALPALAFSPCLPAQSAPRPAPAPGGVAEDGRTRHRLPTVFTLFAEMRLRPEARRAPREMFTIESVQRPSEN